MTSRVFDFRPFGRPLFALGLYRTPSAWIVLFCYRGGERIVRLETA